MRQRRQSLSRWQVERSRLAIHRHIQTSAVFQNSHLVAAYVESRGEVPLSSLLLRARALGKSVALPVIDDEAGSMGFAPCRPGQTLVKNRFGIGEPRSYQRIKPEQLDLVLVPLLAFDGQGQRLGMGGGYYDRYFAFRNNSQKRFQRRPHMMGVAYSWQEQVLGQAREWDVNLDSVVTERGWLALPR